MGGRRLATTVVVALLLLTGLPLVPGLVPEASAQGETPDNLMINPGFERAYNEPTFGPRPIYWHPDPQRPPDDTEMFQDGRYHHNGSNSIMIGMVGVSPDEEARWYQSQNAEGGATVPFGGWVRADLEEGSRLVLRVIVNDDSRQMIDSREVSLEDDQPQWVELRGEPFVLADDTARIRMECVLLGPGTVWFDDVYVGIPTDMSNPPFVVSVPPLEAILDLTYTYQARAVDLEGDAVTFALSRGPEGMNVTPGGKVTWVPDVIPEDAVKVVIQAIDEGGAVSYQDFFIHVLEERVQRPVYVYLYSAYDDPFNDDISGERYAILMPIIANISMDHPELSPSVTILLNGADVTDPAGGRSGAIRNITRAIEEGWAEVGYTAFHEPTYSLNPLYDPTYYAWEWQDRVTAFDHLLSRPRDPLTGEELAVGQGGIQAVRTELGEMAAVAGVGIDGAQLHSLSRYDVAAIQLGIEDGPSNPGTIVGDPYIGTIASMLAEDVATPYGVYWQGGRLRVALDETGVGFPVASDGEGSLSDTFGSLDDRRVNLLPLLVMDPDLYFNASKVVSGDQGLSPTEWAYGHTDSPGLPLEAIRPLDERQRLYDASGGTVEWLADHALPSVGGSFVSNRDIAAMVDPGTGISVSQSEIAAAANDLLARWTLLRYPNWVGTSWGFCRGDYQYFSMADMYGLLAQALAEYDGQSALPASVALVTIHGPTEGASPSQPWNRLRLGTIVDEAVRQADQLTDDIWRVTPHNAVPTTSAPGGVDVNAMEFLLLMAEAYLVLYEGTTTGDPLLSLYPSLQWPVTQAALDLEGKATDTGDSWTLKPASSDIQQDTEPPTVRYVTPAHGSEDVPLSSNITVTFSERMDETIPLEGNLVVEPGVDGNLRWEYHKLVLDPWNDLADNTTYIVTVRVDLSDAAGNPLAAEVTWSFSTVGLENEPPFLIPWPEEREVVTLENQTVRLGVIAEDDGPAPLRYSWRLDGLLVVGARGDSFVYTPTYTDEGEHTVTVVVSDSGSPPGTSTFTWNVSVVNVNLPPFQLGRSPASPDVSVQEAEGGTQRFSVEAEDPDEGYLEYGWFLDEVTVDGSQVEDGGATYVFRFDHDSAAEYTVTCQVRDRSEEGFDVVWEVTVEDVNRAPLILSIGPDPPPTVEVWEKVTVVVNATDPDGDELLYSWYLNGIPVAATTVGEWLFIPDMEGSFTISVLVEDDRQGEAQAQTSVNVLPEPAVIPEPEPSMLPWVLLLVAMALIILVLAWPHLKWLREGGNEL